ncbi:hypothetical protein ZWY2020_049580 [Hordeum vulgare]|nr:hypothetical protein ZWY2020_049580 [Hordeum vulgare]
MWGGDHLSVLPDDLLRRILHFAPVNEAASTSALSKRWRGLWCSSGAVNLETRVPERTYEFMDEDDSTIFSRRDAFVSGARLALEAAAASGSPVTRLSFCVEASRDWRFLYWGKNNGHIDVLADLLSLPAARHVEELRITNGASVHLMSSIHLEYQSPLQTNLQPLSFLTLPSETLRVLDLTSCAGLEPSSGVAFPRLESLRLSLCNVRNEHLQAIIDAAPALATLRLESVVVLRKPASPTTATGGFPAPPEDVLIFRIHCPAATALVLDRCSFETGSQFLSCTFAVEIDAPRLRRFTYNGVLRQISLNPQPTDFSRADLHIIHERFTGHGDADARRHLVAFWRFARNFTNAKELRLRVNSLDQTAVVAAASRTKLLCPFPNLQRLEIEGMHGVKGKTAAVAIANLLQCCPVLRDLQINLSTQWSNCDRHCLPGTCILERKYRHDLDKSIHAFENRGSEPLVSFVVQDDDDGDAYHHLSDLPALSGRVFPCLQTSLRRVGLQFRLEKGHNNFGAKLIKFFAQNAMVLEEMQIDGGNGKMRDHINCNIERWLSSSSNDIKTSFTVLPLERRNHDIYRYSYAIFGFELATFFFHGREDYSCVIFGFELVRKRKKIEILTILLIS